MRRIGMVGAAMMVVAFAGTPALAAHKSAAPKVSCKEIKDAMAAGKTAEDVEKDMKVSSSRVKSCTAPAHHKGKATAKHT
jgi:hypothetical protein